MEEFAMRPEFKKLRHNSVESHCMGYIAATLIDFHFFADHVSLKAKVHSSSTFLKEQNRFCKFPCFLFRATKGERNIALHAGDGEQANSNRSNSSVEHVPSKQPLKKTGRNSLFDVYPEFPLKREESGDLLNFHRESDTLFSFGLSATELFKQFEKAMSIDDSATILGTIRQDHIDRNSLRDLTRDYLKTTTSTVTGTTTLLTKTTSTSKTKLNHSMFGYLDLGSYPGNENDLGLCEGTEGGRSCDLEGLIQGEKPDRVQGSDRRVEGATNPSIVNIDCLDSQLINDQTDYSEGTSESPVNLADPLSEDTQTHDMTPVRGEGAPTPVRSVEEALEFLEQYVPISDAMDDEAIFCETRIPRMLQAQDALDAFLNDTGAFETSFGLPHAARGELIRLRRINSTPAGCRP